MAGLMGQLQQQDRATQVGLSLALVAVVAGAAYVWYANRKPRSKHFFSFTPLPIPSFTMTTVWNVFFFSPCHACFVNG
jgi:hypothetical protein